jgi:hypothetical protein
MGVLRCGRGDGRQVVAGGAGVDGGAGQPGDGVDEVGFGVVGELVGLSEAETRVDVEIGLGVQDVTDPADLDGADGAHPGCVGQHVFGPVDEGRVDEGRVDEGRVDGVHEAAQDLADR